MTSKVPPLTTAQNADALDAAHRAMAEQGITSYLDASVGKTELAALAALADRGPLTVRPSVAVTVGAGIAADPHECFSASSECARPTPAPGSPSGP